ncbi:hypothetical protein F5X68DRAFT_252899 [Plectosphaerella plurivora]|uniref:Glucose-methanol-choline oxidoreductase N-terminal domain-containing protein n=1 Tax=Plectosphaerella plurivora TaxID=936078 RepID=A0A9P8UZZ9_9PEZI|nr:hypothetical protein F5X68DRAFT_252899 [Plectosphaerella plurivora]
MSTVDSLHDTCFDYVIVGGGTAGCVIASRLAEALPDQKILMIEAGPTDLDNKEVLDLRNMYNLMGGEYDYGYKSIPQPRGNSEILHSRAKVLGGCSSHNGTLAVHPFKYDIDKWVEAGAVGWDWDTVKRLIRKIRTPVVKIHDRHRNAIVYDFMQATNKALDLPILDSVNPSITSEKGLGDGGVSFCSLMYDQETGYRVSASVAYIHPILKGEEKRPNLTILTNAWVERLNITDGVATGASLSLKSGKKVIVKARKETILCAGAFDTPKLLLISGIGPRKELEDLGVPVVNDLPGVGENLQDHPEVIITWELHEPLEDKTVMWADAALLARREPANIHGDDGNVPDAMMHIYTMPFAAHQEALGYKVPKNVFSLTPNVPRSRSRGKVWLKSTDPRDSPAIDFRYFTDPEGYDEKTVVWSFRAARKIVAQEPLKKWIKREVAPGPAAQTDEQLSEYGRKTSNTVYHPCGTAKMGDTKYDSMAVVDPALKVKGIKKLRVADASVFPLIPTINLMLTVLAVGERAAEMIIADAGKPVANL